MCLLQTFCVESKCIDLGAIRDYGEWEACRRLCAATEHVSLAACQRPIDRVDRECEVTSSSVPCEPNCENSNQGCGDAEKYLQFAVQFHDVFVCLRQDVGLWLSGLSSVRRKMPDNSAKHASQARAVPRQSSTRHVTLVHTQVSNLRRSTTPCRSVREGGRPPD
jgi:hypothetical protein